MSKFRHKKQLFVLGIRGIPACHGGFETFAEKLALYLVKSGWHVKVFCQTEAEPENSGDSWNGIELIRVPVSRSGAMGTVIFDWKSALMAAREAAQERNSIVLTFGYNTALFWLVYRIRGVRNIANMDGLEWKRQKWSLPVRTWFFVNEKIGCWVANHLIADHPEIKRRLCRYIRSDKITTAWYGSDSITSADVVQLDPYGLTANRFVLVIARPEPENSILEIVSAFSATERGVKLVVLGNFDSLENDYHADIKKAASNEVVFPGAIYQQTTLAALRFFCRLYVHGHQVGGTNPSLLEAMGASSAILAHDNAFNRWVAGEGAQYFSSTYECASRLDRLLSDDDEIERLKKASQVRHKELFTWDRPLQAYEKLLSEWFESTR